MNKIKHRMLKQLSVIWSSTSFHSSELSLYALPLIASESKKGVAVLSLAALFFLVLACALCVVLGLGRAYVYTYAALAALSLHIHLSAWRMADVKVLYLLAMALLVISGSSLVLIAQQSGKIDTMIFSSVAVLLMLVPIVPWGLREASMTVGAIYLMFTSSTLISRGRFSVEELWILQLLMLFTAFVSVLLVIRALAVRKHDLQTQYELHKAHNEMRELSNRDHLTGAWNRRFLETQFDAIVGAQKASGSESYFALFDVDRFKQINDSFGHNRGDDVLKAVEAAFREALHVDEYIVRLGGDEFALLLCGSRPHERIGWALGRVSGLCEDDVAAVPPRPTFSVGLVALAAHARPCFEQAYRLADEALYDAKRAGGNRIVQHRSHWHSRPPACVDTTGVPT